LFELTPISWKEGMIMIPDPKQKSLFYMRLTFEDRLICVKTILSPLTGQLIF